MAIGKETTTPEAGSFEELQAMFGDDLIMNEVVCFTEDGIEHTAQNGIVAENDIAAQNDIVAESDAIDTFTTGECGMYEIASDACATLAVKVDGVSVPSFVLGNRLVVAVGEGIHTITTHNEAAPARSALIDARNVEAATTTAAVVANENGTVDVTVDQATDLLLTDFIRVPCIWNLANEAAPEILRGYTIKLDSGEIAVRILAPAGARILACESSAMNFDGLHQEAAQNENTDNTDNNSETVEQESAQAGDAVEPQNNNQNNAEGSDVTVVGTTEETIVADTQTTDAPVVTETVTEMVNELREIVSGAKVNTEVNTTPSGEIFWVGNDVEIILIDVSDLWTLDLDEDDSDENDENKAKKGKNSTVKDTATPSIDDEIR